MHRKRDPYDTSNLDRVKWAEGMELVGKYSMVSALATSDGKFYAGEHGCHQAMVVEAMNTGGRKEGTSLKDVEEEYYKRTGTLKVNVANGNLTVLGYKELTDSQKKTLKDVCMYANITDPAKIELIVLYSRIEESELVA